MLVLVNRTCHHGKGEDRFRSVLPVLERRFPDLVLFEFMPPFDLTTVIRHEVEHGDRRIISCGGDGTLNSVINTIMSACPADASTITVGGVGLGSSNDALKPFGEKIQGIPVSIDTVNAAAIDLGMMQYQRPDGTEASRYFIANAGLGVIAAANRMFNQNDRITHAFKRISVNAAITAVALRTIARWNASNFTVSIGGQTERTIAIDTMSVVKIPWVSGGMHYDEETSRDSGLFGIHISERQGRFGLLRLMADLSRGRFSGRPGRSTVFARSVSVSSEHPFDLECDGEVDQATRVRFSVVPRAINWMGGVGCIDSIN